MSRNQRDAILIVFFSLVGLHVGSSLNAEALKSNPVDELALRQEQVADKYSRLEALMLKMADVDAATNPRRAALLRRAVAQSNERNIRHQLQELIKFITDEELDLAVDHQKDLHTDLQALLKLLLSENRSKHLQDEQARVRSYIKEIERILRKQRVLQARTENSDPPERLSELQLDLAERTDQLNRRMKENEENGSSAQSRQSSDPSKTSEENGPPNPSQEKDANRKIGEGTKGEGADKKEGNQGKGASRQSNKGGDGQSSEGEQSGSQSQQLPSPSSPQSPSFAPRRRVASAQDRMQNAGDKLDDQQRDDAIVDQEKAQEELHKAIAELEMILRQMREEEIERVLAMLETRFRKMLEMQVKVYEDTQRLSSILATKRGYEEDIEAGKLSFEQRKIVVETDRVLTLLHDEGSSIVFPEVVGQARDDMDQVAERLAETKVGDITQAIEQDIIAALEEMIEALQLEQKKRQEEQMPPPPPGGGRPPDQSLVDMLAELKMIRSMENRVYKRTQRYAKRLDDVEDLTGQANDPELVAAIRRLSRRQERIHEITRDLVLGKNR